ncbi:MAG: hypothetical protein MR936_17835 [Eubacterium sp.]|nr:hypothetical protein [Eubacterium sp.]
MTAASEDAPENDREDEDQLKDGSETTVETEDKSRIAFWILTFLLSGTVFLCEVRRRLETKE